MRNRLIEIFKNISCCSVDDGECLNKTNKDCEKCGKVYIAEEDYEKLADHLIKNSVFATPFIAMVEKFIKDGKFDRRITAHNGKYAVVYVDKSKWSSCPLIDITEQHYNADKAVERIQALKGGSE